MESKEANNTYAVTDPYKVAMLLCMGATIKQKITENPNSIVFIMQHSAIKDMVEKIHTGQPLELHKFTEHHQSIMKFIKDIKMNRRLEKQKGDTNEK